MNLLEEYFENCRIFGSPDEGYFSWYNIDAPPVSGGLRFPDPRYRSSRMFRERAAGIAIGEMFPPEDVADSLSTPLCEGGDLDPQRLLLAYSYGIFPWFSFEDKTPLWWAPLSRFVLFPDEIHISHSMRTLLNKKKYRVSVNEAFPEVIEACRTVNGRYDSPLGPWLGEDIIKAYTELWRQGYVKSVEVWDIETGKLSGGLYGVWLNGCFMGESMFSYVSSGSKIAMIALCGWMKEQGGKVIDLQIETEHLKSMGGRPIPYMEYLRMLNPEAAEGKSDTLPDLLDAPSEELEKHPLLDISTPLQSAGHPDST